MIGDDESNSRQPRSSAMLLALAALGLAAAGALAVGWLLDRSDTTAARPTACLDGPRQPGATATRSCREQTLYATDDAAPHRTGDAALSVRGRPGTESPGTGPAFDGSIGSSAATTTEARPRAGAARSAWPRDGALPRHSSSAFAADPASMTGSISRQGLGLTVYGICEHGLDESGLLCRPDHEAGARGTGDVQYVAPRTISGRILGTNGLGISGIQVIAKPTAIYDDSEATAVRHGSEAYRTLSDSLGFYSFRALPEGDYTIRTQAHGPYPSARTEIRSGTKYADLVLREEKEVFLSGRVLTATGEPLEGVTVLPIVVGVPSVITNDFGEYLLTVGARPDARSLKLRFQRPGFREAYVTVPTPPAGWAEGTVPDTIMAAVEYWTSVTGTVTTTDGDALARRTVELRPLGEQRVYTAETDRDGRFRFDAVEAPLAYKLHVAGGAGHKDYRDQLHITSGGAEFDIVVEPYEFGELRGQLVNLDGEPVPDFDLVLRNTASADPSAVVSSDSSGNFSISAAPAGELVMASQSMPSFLVRGLRVAAGRELSLPVVLDWGEHEIRGLVVDRFGHPVPASRILLKWTHEADGISSVSTRRTAADAQGNFSFSQIGPGPHSLLVDADGFASVALDHDASRQGYDLTVRLN